MDTFTSPYDTDPVNFKSVIKHQSLGALHRKIHIPTLDEKMIDLIRETTPVPIKKRLKTELKRDKKLNFVTARPLLQKEELEMVRSLKRWEKGDCLLPSVRFQRENQSLRIPINLKRQAAEELKLKEQFNVELEKFKPSSALSFPQIKENILVKNASN